MYKLKVSAREDAPYIEFITMGELAKLCGKSKETLKKLTNRGILPDSNFRTNPVEIKRGERQGEYIEGYRLYSKQFLVPKLAPYLKKNIKRGVMITREQHLEIIEMFNWERETLLNL